MRRDEMMVKLDSETKVLVIKVADGNAIWNSNKFEAISPRPLTESEIDYLQDEMGYCSAGYDGPWLSRKNVETPSGTFFNSWSCSGSCD
jgi:hypothetical protein